MLKIRLLLVVIVGLICGCHSVSGLDEGDTAEDTSSDKEKTKFLSIDAGGDHVCGITVEKTVMCWGYDFLPSQELPDEQFESISSSGASTCGITQQQQLICRGLFELDEETEHQAVSTRWFETCWIDQDAFVGCMVNNGLVPEDAAESVTVGEDHSCALHTDNTISCWSKKEVLAAIAPSGKYHAVSAGTHHNCAIKDSGAIHCWGDDGYERLDAPSGTFTAISCSGSHSCAVRTNGTVECWGKDDSGETKPPAGKFKAITTGTNISCGIHTDDTVECWGDNGRLESLTP